MSVTGGHFADVRRWLTLAVELSKKCPPSTTAFSVGAVIVDKDGTEMSRGFSRETPHAHAEESALGKLGDDDRLPGATLYSSLEPCASRRSRGPTCTELILSAGIQRVVIAWREPPVFVHDPQGLKVLCAAGVTVVELPDLADSAAASNAHILGGQAPPAA